MEKTEMISKAQRALNLLMSGDENDNLLGIQDFRETLVYLYRQISIMFIQLSEKDEPVDSSGKLSTELLHIENLMDNIGKMLKDAETGK